MELFEESIDTHRRGMALFNFLKEKHENDKRIGELKVLEIQAMFCPGIPRITDWNQRHLRETRLYSYWTNFRKCLRLTKPASWPINSPTAA
jgi:hypothetical protein